MIFHENRLLADDSHEISYLIFSKIGKDFAKFAVCCSCDWRFKGLLDILMTLITVRKIHTWFFMKTAVALVGSKHAPSGHFN